MMSSKLRLESRSLEYIHSFTVFPDALNYAGNLFGGKLLAELDLATSNAARKMIYQTECTGVVTVKGEVDFKSPGNLGDIIEMRSCISHLGRTSIQVKTIGIKESIGGKSSIVCNAYFTFVSTKSGIPHPHHLKSFAE